MFYFSSIPNNGVTNEQKESAYYDLSIVSSVDATEPNSLI
jgi:hypothetical protein